MVSTENIKSSSYTRLLEYDNKVDQISISVVEKDKVESERLIVSLKKENWTYMAHENNVPINKMWTIKFNSSAILEDLNENNIYILNESGERVSTKIVPSEDRTSVSIQANDSFTNGEYYYLYVHDAIRNSQTYKALKTGYIKVFSIID